MDGMVTHTLDISYEVTRKGYKSGASKVAITEGYTTVHDVYHMLSRQLNVRPAEIIIKLIKEI